VKEVTAKGNNWPGADERKIKLAGLRGDATGKKNRGDGLKGKFVES